MDLKITEFPFGIRGQVTLTDPEFLKAIGEDGMRQLVSDFYDLLVQSEIKHLFPINKDELAHSKQNSADFMIQICGGPDYFNQRRGNPMMARRHAPFAITPEARIVWLNCYRQVIERLDAPESLIVSFWNYLNVFSHWMVNAEK